MNAFITGSRVYGRPTSESDVDLVIRVNDGTAKALRRLCDKSSDMVVNVTKALTKAAEPDGDKPTVVRFGKLNLILCETDDEYAMWKLGTSHMRIRRNTNDERFDQKEAKEIFDHLRDMVALVDKGDSSQHAVYAAAAEIKRKH